MTNVANFADDQYTTNDSTTGILYFLIIWVDVQKGKLIVKINLGETEIKLK